MITRPMISFRTADRFMKTLKPYFFDRAEGQESVSSNLFYEAKKSGRTVFEGRKHVRSEIGVGCSQPRTGGNYKGNRAVSARGRPRCVSRVYRGSYTRSS